MSGHPLVEELEAMSAETLAHVAQCAACAREVAWLRAERALLSRRPAPGVEHLWAGVEERTQAAGLRPSGLGRPQASGFRPQGLGGKFSGWRPRWGRRVAFSAAGVAAVAAVLVLALRPRVAPIGGQGPGAQGPVAQRDDFRPDPKALAALDRAEADYRDAAKVLEGEYERLRPQLDPALAKRWDETLSRAHTQLGEARKVAGDDVNARMQVLDGYAGYLRSLGNVVRQSEEANP